jgi:2-aminoadipate transaminase
MENRAFSLSDGYAPVECFPNEALGEIAREVLRQRSSQALQYGRREGYRPLRELIAEWLQADGVAASAEEIAIVTGAKQGIDLVARACAEAGQFVVGSQPTYMNALRIFARAGLSMLPVAADEKGLQVDALERTLVARSASGAPLPRLIYEIPDFQNPTGTVLPEERREKLLAVAARFDIPILEDNPYRALRYDGDAQLPLKRFDGSGLVISVGSFAKILGPGLRVGWIHARPELLTRILAYKADAGTSPLTQMIVHTFFREPDALQRHVGHLTATLRVKRDRMLAALSAEFTSVATWTRPLGGYYVWVTLLEDLSGDDIVAEAAKEGVECFPGSAFYSDGQPRRQFRLAFSHETPERIEMAIAKLRAVVNRQTSRHSPGAEVAAKAG